MRLMLLAAALNLCLSGPLSVGLACMAKNRFATPAAFGGWIAAVACGTLIGVLLAGVYKSHHRGLLLSGRIDQASYELPDLLLL